VVLILMTVAFAMTVLVYTNVWDPRPAVNTWLARVLALSTPEPQWTTRTTGPPDSAAVMLDGTTVVASRGFVDGYARSDGTQLWQIKVNWSAPAGDVVVAQQRPDNPDRDPAPDTGYSVINPATGNVLWGDKDATAVWTYRNAIIDLACPGGGGCQLRSRPHVGGTVAWSIGLPSQARLIHGVNPHLVGTRDPAGWFGEAAAGTPGDVPPVLAIPLDGGRVELVDTFQHKLAREVSAPDPSTRLSYSGDSVLYVHAEPASVGCLYRVQAVNFASGQVAWQHDGYDVDTASGADCVQRKDPVGADSHLVVTDPGKAPLLVESDTGKAVWTGVPGQKVLAAGNGIAVVENADRKTVEIVDVEQAGQKPTWTGQMGLEPEAAVTADWVIIRDGDAGRVLVFSRFGMTKRAEIKTSADVIGYGPAGVLLGSGRRFGFVPVSGGGAG
jgi:outer membrane protein assembly factor BamB